MIKKIQKLSFFFLLLFLVNCSAYVDSRREAGKIATVGQSTENMLALCYNPLFVQEDEMQKLANQSCKSHKAIKQPDKTKYFNCSFFFPNTAFYQCQ